MRTLAYKVIVTGPAKADAHGYASYVRLEQKSPNAAREWLQGLRVETARLSQNPKRFAVIPEAKRIGVELRSFMYHSHRIIYQVNESTKMVLIVRIFHGARKLRKDDIV